MELITSKDNKTVKTARSLTAKKYRRKLGLFLAEGLRTVVDLLPTGTVKSVLLRSDSPTVVQLSAELQAVAAQAEAVLKQDPFGGHLFVFRGRRGDLVKVIWWDGQGACMFMKRLERGRFVWPSAKEGKVALTPAQLSMLLEGIDWRAPQRTWRPLAAG